jgi:hypothetical protein
MTQEEFEEKIKANLAEAAKMKANTILWNCPLRNALLLAEEGLSYPTTNTIFFQVDEGLKATPFKGNWLWEEAGITYALKDIFSTPHIEDGVKFLVLIDFKLIPL